MNLNHADSQKSASEFFAPSLHNELLFSSGPRGPWRLPLPGGKWLNPAAPDAEALDENDVFAAWSRGSIFGGFGSREYSPARHALLVSHLFSDPKLALAGLLYSVPEAFYGRLSNPVAAFLPPGSNEIYRRFCAALRRALYARFGLQDLTRCELDLVAGRDALAWNMAFFKSAMGGVLTPQIDEAEEQRFRSVDREFRGLRDEVLAGRVGCFEQYTADSVAAVAPLLRFDESVSERDVSADAERRLRYLWSAQNEFRNRQKVEPELEQRYGYDSVVVDELAHEPFVADECMAPAVVVGVPAVVADELPVTTGGGEPSVDWSAVTNQDESLKPFVDQLRRRAASMQRAAQERIHHVARMQAFAAEGVAPAGPEQNAPQAN